MSSIDNSQTPTLEEEETKHATSSSNSCSSSEEKKEEKEELTPEEIKTLQEQEQKRQKEEIEKRLGLVFNPRINSCIGVVPSVLALQRGWDQFHKPVPLYQQHGYDCPLSPECDKRFILACGIQLHSNLKIVMCTCKMKLDDSKQKMFDYITKDTTGPFSTDPCAIFIDQPRSFVTSTLAMCVVERAIFIESESQRKVQSYADAVTKPQWNCEIEVYVATDVKVDEFYDLCAFQLKRNGRIITPTKNNSKQKLIFHHPNSLVDNIIKILPHKALRVSWNAIPPFNVYIDDVYDLGKNAASLRAMIAYSAFNVSESNQELRKMVLVGTHPALQDYSDLVPKSPEWEKREAVKTEAVVAYHNLMMIRGYAHENQREYRKNLAKKQAAAAQKSKQVIAKLLSSKISREEKQKEEEEEQKEKTALEDYYAIDKEEISVEEYELRKQTKVIHQEVELNQQLISSIPVSSPYH